MTSSTIPKPDNLISVRTSECKKPPSVIKTKPIKKGRFIMTVEVNARHKNISEGFRDYAQQRAEKIGEAFPMVESVRIVMDFQNKLCAAEVIAQREDETFVGSAHTDTSMRAAVDMAAAKVETQIRKKRAKAYVEPARKAAQAAEAAK